MAPAPDKPVVPDFLEASVDSLPDAHFEVALCSEFSAADEVKSQPEAEPEVSDGWSCFNFLAPALPIPPDIVSEQWNSYPSGDFLIGAQDNSEGQTDEDKADEAKDGVNERREKAKCLLAILFTTCCWTVIFLWLSMQSGDPLFEEPVCAVVRAASEARIRSCEKCGVGTNVLPLWGEWERSWNRPLRALLYAFGLFWIFAGMGIVCDQFMAGIEAITNAERVIWRTVAGTRRKFRVKRWNSTVANLTLMALGSSAPEILLVATELVGNSFFSAALGPQTVVGSAAFNMFVISAVCVSALPAPEAKRIECLDAFKVTASVSIFAYVWLLLILLVFTPDRITIVEGVATILFFPVLIALAYAADRGWLRAWVQCKWRPESELTQPWEEQQMAATMMYGKPLPFETLQRLKYGGNNEGSFRRSLAIPTFGKAPSDGLKRNSGTSANGERRNSGSSADGERRTSFSSASGEKRNSFFGRRSISWDKTPDIFLGFAQKKHMVVECEGTVSVMVQLSEPLTYEVHVAYRTREGSALAGSRFVDVSGMLQFKPGETESKVEVPLIDDNVWNPEETFWIELSEIEEIVESQTSPGTSLKGMNEEAIVCIGTSLDKKHEDSGDFQRMTSSDNCSIQFSIRTAVVTILNDDIAGVLVFGQDEVFCKEGTTSKIEVFRNDGWCGEVTCDYELIDDESGHGRLQKGVLRFLADEVEKIIEVPVPPSSEHGQERFKLKMSNATGGAVFDMYTDGGKESAICDIIVAADGDTPFLSRVLRIFLNKERWAVAKQLWAEQRDELLYAGGSIEDQAEAGLVEWMSHILALNWKLMFIIVPPPLVGGGWPCFVAALFLIGCVTLLAGDLASLLGCCLGIPDDITAITFVALGTSLPDTLASRSAAQHDDTADNAVGNVTGSNSVNVFLGCGLAWTAGAVYWHFNGVTPEWRAHKYGKEKFEDIFLGRYSDGGFIVPIPALAFSVAMYVCCAFICLSLLYMRRTWYAGELGGPEHAQRRDSAILFCLWVAFIASTSAYSIIYHKSA